MTISKIRIANFKSFADQTVELKDFNLLPKRYNSKYESDES